MVDGGKSRGILKEMGKQLPWRIGLLRYVQTHMTIDVRFTITLYIYQ